jgi:hypothetical protein
MGQLRFAITGDNLAVPVWIGLDQQTTVARLAAGQSIPTALQARGVLDTGSNVTSVASWILQQLAIPVATVSSTHTPAGPVNVNLRCVSLGITDPTQPVGAPWLTEPTLLVIELTTILPDADVLVGLDVLFGCKMLLDGPGKWFSLDF